MRVATGLRVTGNGPMDREGDVRRLVVLAVLSLLIVSGVPAEEPTPTPPAPTRTPGPPVEKLTSPLSTPEPLPAGSPMASGAPDVQPWMLLLLLPLVGGLVVLGAVALIVARRRAGRSQRG